MAEVSLGLVATDGDRLGHLVRGVQMLRSYGWEMDVQRYSDVVEAAVRPGWPAALCCVLTGQSAATLEGLQGICRETEWALGDDERVLNVTILRYDGQPLGEGVEALHAIDRGAAAQAGMTQHVPAATFERLCDWGQSLTDDERAIMGEWPDATGR